jgi:hypothetical protein
VDWASYHYLPVIFLAVFAQTFAGFGSGQVAMTLLPQMIGLRVATPVVALMSVTLETVSLVRHRAAINPRAVWRLIAGALGISIWFRRRRIWRRLQLIGTGSGGLWEQPALGAARVQR